MPEPPPMMPPPMPTAVMPAVTTTVAPPVDTWPSTITQPAPPRHPASGRAVARPVVPSQSQHGLDPEDLPSAGSPPGGGSGPVYTG
jgi:hypothetical protein